MYHSLASSFQYFSRWAICISHFSSLSSALWRSRPKEIVIPLAIPFVFSEVWSAIPRLWNCIVVIYNVAHVEAMSCGPRIGRSMCECVKRFKKVWTLHRVVNSCWLRALGHGVSDTATHVQYVVMHVYDGNQRSGVRVMSGMRSQRFLKGADGRRDTGCCYFSSRFCFLQRLGRFWLTDEKLWDKLRCLIGWYWSDVFAEAAQPEFSSSHHSL